MPIIADGADHFTIDEEDGVLKFSSPPDFENPGGEGASFQHLQGGGVAACDVTLDTGTGACPTTGNAGYLQGHGHGHRRERARQGDLGHRAPRVERRSTWSDATLRATASDGDITDADSGLLRPTVAGEVTGVAWRWYRGGTEITDAQHEHLHPPNRRCKQSYPRGGEIPG